MPGEIEIFFRDSLVLAKAQLQPAHPSCRALDITECHDIHEFFVIMHFKMLGDI